jgi:Putative polyhydroxyalkanoic acid system protein (PHA_gran_rgn)
VYAEVWWRIVRITVSHDRSTEEVKEAVDRSFDDVLKAILILPIHLIQMQRTWQGNTLTFSLVARKGVLSSPIKGTVEITDRDITFDIALGFLERLIPAAKARKVLTDRVRGLLK